MNAIIAISVTSWAAFYFVCFVVGFALMLLSFIAGSVHLHIPARLHLPHVGQGAGHGAQAHAQVPIINFSTIVAFLGWFGGTGYLLLHFGHAQVLIGFVLALLGGLTGGSIVFWFLVKLMSYDRALDPADYDLIGVIGHVNVAIREGGTGEVVFSQAGTRRVAGARADGDGAIAKGSEVVITRYEHGIAYVKLWDEFSGELHDLDDDAADAAGTSSVSRPN
jgi:hypothetical protein